MINAPSGMPAGLPTTSGLPCADAPPPLVGGGLVAASPQSPLQSPLQVGVPQPPFTPVHGAGAFAARGAATLGASTLTAVPAGGLFAATVPAFVPGPAAGVATGAAAAPAPTGPTPAMAAPAATHGATTRMTTVAPGAQQADADMVEGTLAVLRQSPAGAQLVDRMLAVGARVNVISDAEFKAMGHGDAHAFFDPKIDTIFLRRSDLGDAAKVRFAAVALAHEGTHLLDDVGQVSDAFVQQAAQNVQLAGGPTSARGAEVQRQAMFELTMIKEARAFLFAGQVARQLGVARPASDPTSVGASGENDATTYDRVWQALLKSGYNPERRTSPTRSF